MLPVTTPRGSVSRFILATVTVVALMGGFLSAAPVAHATPSNWLRTTTLSAVDAATFEDSSITADGTRIVIGAPLENSEAGAAYVFRRSSQVWVLEQRITATVVRDNGYFGSTVDISGDGSAIVVGSEGVSLTYVFRRTGTDWVQEAELGTASGFQTSVDRVNVAIDTTGTRIAVAMPHTTSLSIWSQSGGTWSREYLYTAVSNPFFNFGNFVAISGDGSTVAVGNEDCRPSSRGAVITFTRTGSTWSPFETLYGGGDQRFGSTVALSEDGNVLGVTARHTMSQLAASGALYLYRKSGNAWSLEATEITPTGSANTGEVFLSADGSLAGVERSEGIALFSYSLADSEWNPAATAPPCSNGYPTGGRYRGALAGDATVFTCAGSVRTEASAPGPPLAVGVSAVRNTMTIAWTPPSDDGGTQVTSYSVTATPGGAVCTKTSAPWACTITLPLEVTYSFAVTATNGAGTSSQTSSEPFRPRSEPSAPTIDAVEPLSGDRALITFTPGTGYGDPVVSNTITCTSSNGGTTRSASGTGSPITVSGLTTEATYRCHGTSVNDVGSSAQGYSTDFLASRRLTIAAISGEGSITDATGAVACAAACIVGMAPGQTATLTANPAAGWVFAAWGGVCAGSGSTCSTLMNQSREVSATFVPAPTPTSEASSAKPLSTGAGTKTPISPVIRAVSIINGSAKLTFDALAGTRYSISATNGKKTKTGTCAVIGGKAACAIKLSLGAWGIKVTPVRAGLKGAPTRKTIKVR